MKQLITLIFLFTCLHSFAQTCVPNTNSLSFRGPSSGDHVSFSSDNGLVIADSITVEAWIYDSIWAPTAAQGTILCKHSWTNGEQGYVLRAGDNGTLSFTIAGDSLGIPTSWKEVLSPTGSMIANAWYHVAGSFDGDSLKLYINGNEVASLAFTGKIVPSTSYPIAIGMISDQGNAFLGRYWQGKMDEVRVWHRALPQSEIQARMNHHLDTAVQSVLTGLAGYWRFNENSGTLTHDLSGNNNNGTLSVSSQWNGQVPFTNGPLKPTISYNSPILTCDSSAYAYQWFFYNNPILINGTLQTYTATQNGVYFVQVSDPLGCTTMSNAFPIINLAVNELAAAGIAVSCNYQQSEVTITTISPARMNEVVLTDASGRTVIAEKCNSENVRLTFNKPPQGIYLLNIYSSSGKYVKKLWIGN